MATLNLFISFVIGKILIGLLDNIKNKSIEILSSKSQIEELHNVLERPRLQKFISRKRRKTLYGFFERETTQVIINEKVEACRDKKDDFILEIAFQWKSRLHHYWR